jgi:hypothetical protein
LSVTVAAKWTVSSIADAVSIAGRKPTHAAPMLPIDWWDSDWPMTPYEYSAVKIDTSAAPEEAASVTTFPT